MAKISTKVGNSKIRFIMLEADLADGDLTQITQAISNALRPAAPTRMLGAPKGTAQLGPEAATGTLVAEPEELDEDLESEETTNGEGARAARRTTPRKYPTPSVVEVDLDGGEMPFEKFATEKQPKSVLKKHLLVAYWFKNFRETASITADHAYTCYKKMGWSTKVKDFAQPFRDLERQSLGSIKDREFSINHIGEDAIRKLTG